MSRKLLAISLLVILTLSMIFVYADEPTLPNASSEFYVYDGAKLLDSVTKRHIISNNEALYKKTGAQIVVATVDSLDGATIEEYAVKLFEKWKIGSKEKNNGILLLVALGDRKVRIEVGYGLEAVITDGKAGEILDDYIIGHFKQDNYQKGILNGFNALIEILQLEYGMDVTVDPIGADDEVPSISNLFVFAAIVIFILYRMFYKGNPRSRAWRGRSYKRRSSGGRRSFGGGGSSGGGGASRGW